MEETVSPYYGMELSDYFSILKRRKWTFLLMFFLILAIGILIAYSLPAVYRSEATIIIERQEIPTELVATTVTGYVQERIQGIRQRLVTYDNLVEIEKKLDIYPEMRAAGDINEMVTLIKKNINVEMVDVETNDKRGQTVATIAFTVGYEAEIASVAQKVAAALADRYLQENKQARSEQAADVSEFLGVEAERLKVEIITLEKKLASFKQERISELPELMQVNMRLYEKAEGQIETTKDRITKLEDTKASIESELSLTNPRKAVTTDEGKIIQGPTDRLNVLISEFLQSSARYTSSHPDMVRIKREIKILGGQSRQGAEVNQTVANITKQRNKLLDARQKYGADHPDVLRLEKSISVMESALRNIELTSNSTRSALQAPADNPRYVALKTQLDSTKSNLKEERARLRQYSSKLDEYEKRLFQTPVVERDYKSLSRDYSNAQKKYSDLKDKQIQARLAEQVEAGDKAERFVLAGNAYLPTSPVSPNRLGIVMLAGLLAFGGGLGGVTLSEFKDRSVRGRRGVTNLFGAGPIAIIPYIETTSDISTRSKSYLYALLVVLIIVLVLVGIYFNSQSSSTV